MSLDYVFPDLYKSPIDCTLTVTYLVRTHTNIHMRVTRLCVSTNKKTSRPLTMSDTLSTPFIYMAPLRGITDALFRQIYCKHFEGINAAVAPFINPQRKSGHIDKLLADVSPQASDLDLIPQLLNTNGDDFLALAQRLYDLGYNEINWNLGCPVPMVAKKRRGSGLLPFPDQIVAFLDYVLPRLKTRLSLKMRLGYHDHQESLTLLPLLDRYPLSDIIIHARLGKQLYRGVTSPDRFILCQRVSRHRLVYNGDINTSSDYHALNRLIKVDRWMIGRGLIANPFLPSEIKSNRLPDQLRNEKLQRFHDELFLAMKERLDGPGHLLGRMKQIWIYLISSFPGKRNTLKKITKATTEGKYLDAVQSLFLTE